VYSEGETYLLDLISGLNPALNPKDDKVYSEWNTMCPDALFLKDLTDLLSPIQALIGIPHSIRTTDEGSSKGKPGPSALPNRPFAPQWGRGAQKRNKASSSFFPNTLRLHTGF
jgi:hypothetical protein